MKIENLTPTQRGVLYTVITIGMSLATARMCMLIPHLITYGTTETVVYVDRVDHGGGLTAYHVKEKSPYSTFPHIHETYIPFPGTRTDEESRALAIERAEGVVPNTYRQTPQTSVIWQK